MTSDAAIVNLERTNLKQFNPFMKGVNKRELSNRRMFVKLHAIRYKNAPKAALKHIIWKLHHSRR